MEEQRDMTSSTERQNAQQVENQEELASAMAGEQEEGQPAGAAVTQDTGTRPGGAVKSSTPQGLDAEQEEDESDDEEQPSEEQENFTTMGFDTLCELFREKARQSPSRDARREVQQIYEALCRQLKIQRDEERRRWLAQGGSFEEFVPQARPVEQELREIYDNFQVRRREFMQREDDLRQENLRRKREIIDQIEALTRQAEVKGETFNAFSELRRAWREIGSVPRAEADDLYQSYSHQVQQFYDYVDLNRELRDLDYKKNLEAKTELCERAEELMGEEDVAKAFKELQALHARWKELGPVSREKSDEIWDRFSLASAQINQRHRELIQARKEVYARNLEVRKEIVAQMEALMAGKRERQSDWVETTAKVVALQKAFKDAFPVARSQSNIGDIFFSMCSEFFDSRRAYERAKEAVGSENAEKKRQLCLQAEALRESEKWNDTKEEMISLQRQWREVGYTPRKEDQQLWERFKSAQDYFFDRRNKAFALQREAEQANMQLREALIAELESYAPGDDARAIVEQLKAFQTRWSAIGHVPIRSKEKLQNRFRAALDKHYDKLRHERKELYAQAYEAKLDSLAGGANSAELLASERNKMKKRVEQLAAEKNQLETNMSFFGKGDQNNPLLHKTRQDIERLEREIESAKNQVREINRRIRAEKDGEGDGGGAKQQ